MFTATTTRKIRARRGNRHARRLQLETLEQRTLLATIQGTVFEDIHGNGSRDNDDPAMANVIVFLDQNQNRLLDQGELWTETDENGDYLFTGLDLDTTFFVTQRVSENWLQTSPLPTASPSQLGNVLQDHDLSFLGSGNILGIARDGTTGTLYVVKSGTGIVPIDPASGQMPQGALPFALPTSGTQDITFDNQTRTFWGADRISNEIVRFDFPPEGGTEPVILNRYETFLSDLRGIAWDNTDNSLWVLDRATEAIYHYSADGSFLGESFPAPGSDARLAGLTFDGTNLWTNRSVGSVIDGFSLLNRTYAVNPLDGGPVRDFVAPTVAVNNAWGVAGGETNAAGRSSLWLVQLTDQRLFQVDITAPGSHVVTLTSHDQTEIRDFANFHLGTISGTVFSDINQDGVRDEGEPGLQSWQVYIDVHSDGQLEYWKNFQLTADGGNYTIDGLSPGTYRVAIVQRAPGWSPTTDQIQEITIGSTSGQHVTLDFGQHLSGVGPWGGEIAVNKDQVAIPADHTSGANRRHGGEAVASDAQGNFAITWQSTNRVNPDLLTDYARIFDAAGNPLTDDIPVWEESSGDQRHPAIAMAANGDFTVMWRDEDGLLFARQFNANGTLKGAAFVAFQDPRRNQVRLLVSVHGF